MTTTTADADTLVPITIRVPLAIKQRLEEPSDLGDSRSERARVALAAWFFARPKK